MPVTVQAIFRFYFFDLENLRNLAECKKNMHIRMIYDKRKTYANTVIDNLLLSSSATCR